MVGERNRREMQQDLGLGAVNNSLNRKLMMLGISRTGSICVVADGQSVQQSTSLDFRIGMNQVCGLRLSPYARRQC
jgi:hypothetical protein